MISNASGFAKLSMASRQAMHLAAWLLATTGMMSISSIVDAKAKPVAVDSKQIELGRRIYMEGILPSGKPLQADRAGLAAEGQAAACENCHRSSGMGSLEGSIVAPPIAGKFLFADPRNRPLAIVDTRAASNLTRAHAPYNEASFGKALSQGVNVGGSKMNPLMPHYKLSSAELKALMAYLKQLSAEVSPGVTADSIEFATVLTPDVDAKQREVLLTMMTNIVKQRNASQESRSGQMKMPLDLVPRTPRSWNLAIWDLKGAPETWTAQLNEYYQKQPVFALLSGFSTVSWAPIHGFCQQQKLPCLLPSVDVVPEQAGFYTLYYSQGVALEAKVLAKHLLAKDDKTPRRLIQIGLDDDAARRGGEALSQALANSNVKLETRKLAGLEAAQIQEAFKEVGDKDLLMLWLPSSALAEVGKVIAKPQAAQIYLSGFLAKDDFAFATPAWRGLTRVVYPYELGDKRDKNLAGVRQWLKTWNLPLINETAQAEIFFNMLFLTDLVSQMLDNLHRDYMLERAEDMLSVGSNVSPYPHLGMSRGQRFASKGAYIAKLTDDGKLLADSDWIVP